MTMTSVQVHSLSRNFVYQCTPGMSLANHGYLVLEQKKNTMDQEEQEDITLDEAPEEHLAEWNIEEDYTEDLPPGLTVVESDDESELDLDGADELAEELVAGKYLDGLEDEFCTEVDNEAIYGEKYRNLREQLSGKADEEGQREKEPKNLVQLDGADDNSDSDYEFSFQPRPSTSTKQPPQCTPLSHRSKRLRRSKNPSYMDPSSSSSECDGGKQSNAKNGASPAILKGLRGQRGGGGAAAAFDEPPLPSQQVPEDQEQVDREQGLQGGEAEQVEEVAVGIHEEERRQQVQEDQEQADREQRRQGGIAAISGLRGQRGGGGAAAAFDEPPLPSQQVPEDQEQVDREQRHQGGIAAEEIDQVERRHQGQRDQERAAASDSEVSQDGASSEESTTAGFAPTENAAFDSENSQDEVSLEENTTNGAAGNAETQNDNMADSSEEVEKRTYEQIVTGRVAEARSMGNLRCPTMISCKYNKDKGHWVLCWKKPFNNSEDVKSYKVRVVDDLGIVRDTVVKPRYTRVKIKWLNDRRSYKAEVLAIYDDGKEETSLSVPIFVAKKRGNVPTYVDEKSGKEFIKVPYMGKLYEVFAAKEVK